MPNMSHCRFQNTDRDLSDCEEALEQVLDGMDDVGKLSAEELHAAKRLVLRCYDIAQLVADHAGFDLTSEDDFERSQHRIDAVLDEANNLLSE